MSNDTKNSSNPTYLLEEDMIINDNWKIQAFIAKGGKGEVYLAKQLNLDRQVALKIMSAEFIKSLDGDEEEITSEIMRFRREVKIMARMQHPNILQVFDFDRLEINDIEMDYIVMEYIPGLTLRQKMPEKGFGHDEIKVRTWLKKYFFQILDGMKAVHDKGVVHRDMKPENVLVDDELPKIMDFGISGSYHLDNVTKTHHMLGTISYMPEEQFMDLALTDVRVDVYALGKILYEVVEGKMKKGRDKPFHSAVLNNPQTIFFKTLDQIIQQATAKNRNKRTPSVKALHDSLEALVMDSDRNKKSPTDLYYKYWKYLFGISAVVIIIFTIAAIMHYNSMEIKTTPAGSHIKNQPKLINPVSATPTLPEFSFNRFQPTSLPSINKTQELPSKLLASDNMTMILLKGAKISMKVDNPIAPEGKQTQKTMLVKALYMDKTKITNHLYVQFLNEVDEIEVKNKSVIWNGQLLLLLGEVREDYEPITFKEGHFRVKPDAVTKPVVRVTPIGALAYASFYGKTLPQMSQWWLASHGQTTLKNTSSPSRPQPRIWGGSGMMHNQISESKPLSSPQDSGIQPVTQTTANQAGILGLEQNVNEWTVSVSSDGTFEFHIHGGVGEVNHNESYLKREAWEAFSTVGFRTVLNLDGNN